MNIERRYGGTISVRSTPAGPVVNGYAAVYDSPSRDLGGFVERIDPQAFRSAQARRWNGVRARFDHRDDAVLSSVAAGTLRLSATRTGLYYETPVPAGLSWVVDLVRSGEVRASSFAFIAIDDQWQIGPGGIPVRTLRDLVLIDVAPVRVPAYPATSAGIRPARLTMAA